MNEPSNIGLSEQAHSTLARWNEEERFLEQRDAYKFAVAFALSRDAQPPEISDRKNMFGVATIDADGSLASAVRQLGNLSEGDSVYKYIERLATWGVTEIDKIIEKTGNLQVSDLLKDTD